MATLNWILRAKDYGGAPLADEFEDPTKAAVEAFQADADLGSDGIVDADTSRALVNAMPPQRATWYGPSFFGNETACGQTLTRATLGVAHKTLPCGSKVVLRYRGRFVRTTVIDRGPFANGAKWDLTQATARALHFEYTDDVRVAKLGRAAEVSANAETARWARRVWALRRGWEHRGVGLVLGQRRRVRDQALELVQGHVGDGLEQLLVGPVVLSRLLAEVLGRPSAGGQQRLEEGEQRGFLRVGRGELPRRGDLVEAEPGSARGARVLGDRIRVAAALGHREADPLARRLRQRAAAELVAHARVGAQGRGRSGEHADELGDLAGGSLHALEDRDAALRGGELVVDVKPADVCLDGHGLFLRPAALCDRYPAFTLLLACYLPAVSKVLDLGQMRNPRGRFLYHLLVRTGGRHG